MLPDRVMSDWWRRDGHSLALEDLDEVFDELPERLILGVGAYGRLHPDPAAIAELERRGIAVECLRNHEAVRRYGELDERRTAAALHVTLLKPAGQLKWRATFAGTPIHAPAAERHTIDEP